MSRVHSAIIHGELDKLRALLDKDKTLANCTNENEETPIQIAAQKGSLEAINILIDKGADANKVDPNGMNCLHLATFFNQSEVLKLLNTHKDKMDLNAADNAGNSVLHFAVMGGSIKCLEILLANGVNVDAKNNHNATAVMMAALFHQPNIIEILSKHKDCNLNNQDLRGETALHWAAKCGYTAIIEQLLALNVDKNIENTKGQKAEDVATNKAIKKLLM